MANAREIKSRINSVQDTMKITNAMYMISSSKMKKAKKYCLTPNRISTICRVP